MTTCTAETDQRDRALALAQEIRMRHYHLRTRIKEGTLTVPEAIYEHADDIASMKVARLLQAQDGWGPGRTRHVLHYINASRALQVRELTDRQRDLLCQFIGGRV